MSWAHRANTCARPVVPYLRQEVILFCAQRWTRTACETILRTTEDGNANGVPNLSPKEIYVPMRNVLVIIGF